MFSEKFRSLVSNYHRMLPDLNVDVEAELERYKGFVEQVRPFVVETISYLNTAIKANKSVLVEGANAAMLDIDFGKYISFFNIRVMSKIKLIFPFTKVPIHMSHHQIAVLVVSALGSACRHR